MEILNTHGGSHMQRPTDVSTAFQQCCVRAAQTSVGYPS
jgi:hypothetical protein